MSACWGWRGDGLGTGHVSRAGPLRPLLLMAMRPFLPAVLLQYNKDIWKSKPCPVPTPSNAE